MNVLPRPLRVGLLLALGALAATARATHFDLSTATIGDLQAAMTAGALTSEKLTQLYLARIDAYEKKGPALNTIITLNPKALEQARALDAERKAKGPRSALHGVPVLVKDNYDTFDLPTTGGATALAGAIPMQDAYMVARLRAAGAIILAKTNLDEMALGGNGVSSLGGMTLNPYGLDRIPGGSSAGTGAGIAAVFGAAGLGTETGGSVRHPANDCNLVGLVATEGFLSRAGIMPISFSHDRGGPMARSVYDIAAMLTVMAGLDPNDQMTRASIGKLPAEPFEHYLKPNSLKGKRIGVLRDLFKPGAEDAESNKLIEEAVAVMKKEGALIVDPVSTGTDLFTLTQTQGLAKYEYKYAFNSYMAARGPNQPIKNLTELAASGKFHPRLKERYAEFDVVPPMDSNPDYVGRYRNRAILRKSLEDLADKYDLDAFVYPVRSGPLPKAGTWPLPPGLSGQSVSDYCGLPAITVPAGFTKDGLPQGVELMAKAYEDTKLLVIAYGYEQASKLRKLPTLTPALAGEAFDY